MMRRVGLVFAVLAAAGCRTEPTPAAAGVATHFTALADTTWPPGPLGAAARRGHALLAHTPDSLPQYAVSGLRCFNCHLDEGARRNGLLLIGAFARYPQYRSRSARMETITDRVNDCFKRSLNGRPLPVDGPDMHDIVSYLAYVSRGIELFDSTPGQGLPKLKAVQADTARGAALFAATCSRCHGVDGAGIPPAPPLWGLRSFNIGAGMARLNTAAAFIETNMPFDKPGTLTEQQAYDVASFIVSRPRPDFPGKELDWPKGDPPSDVAYPTAAAAKKAAATRPTPTSAH